jgi:putative tricarboxylic transport membrane protein
LLIKKKIFLPGLSYYLYPVRNNAPLLPPSQRPSGPSAAAGLDFRIIPAGFNAPLEFLTGFTLFVAHCLSVVMAVGFSRGMEKLTKVQAEIISPLIIVLCLIGSYIGREYWQDMMVATIFGIFGYYLKKHGYHPIPLVLGIVLGPIAENGFFQALSFSRNGLLVFITRIPSLIIFLCVLAVIFWPYIEKLYKKPKTSTSKV